MENRESSASKRAGKSKSRKPKLLTSILLVEERLGEAKYFASRLSSMRNVEAFDYNLNAFLSASRTVTFLLQKEMARVPGFEEWWAAQQKRLAADSAARFFVNLRNHAQKAGRVSIAGTQISKTRWSFRFAGNPDQVPASLLQRDIAECCHEHVAKLATLVLACIDRFPYHTCPVRAICPEGLKALELTIEDLESAAGWPKWKIGDKPSVEQRIRYLREVVDGVDLQAIQRLTHAPRRREVPTTEDGKLGAEISVNLVNQLEAKGYTDMGTLIGALLLSRDGSLESRDDGN